MIPSAANPTGNIMIDHVSASWGLDECMPCIATCISRGRGQGTEAPHRHITIQIRFSARDWNTYHHAFGSTIGGLNSTFHHNLWACNTGRNPSVGMIGDFTFVNNVLFNWVHRTVDGGDNAAISASSTNYLKPGPATPKVRRFRIAC